MQNHLNGLYGGNKSLLADTRAAINGRTILVTSSAFIARLLEL